MLKISFSSVTIPDQNALALTIAADQKLGAQGEKLDKKLGGAIKRALAASRFTGASGQTLSIMAPPDTKLSRLVLVGIGDPAKANANVFTKVGGAAIGGLSGSDTQAVLLIDGHKGVKISDAEAAAQAALGACLGSYRFDKYRTKLKADQKPALKSFTIASAETPKAKKLFVGLESLAEGISFARDLVSEPPNVIYPASLAAQCNTLKKLGVKVEVLDEKQIKKLGMGALIGVGMGSDAQPRLVTMLWQGNPSAKDKRPAALVGKGITFDTGGYSLKPPAGMERMKYDMGGSAAVIGAMMALAGRKAKANVLGVVALAENMVSGNAQRPSDIVTTMSGQTVEVLNTDAEGRLVLADAMWYAQEKFKLRCVVDLATLTGAMVVALGHEYAGLFSNDDKLAAQLTKAGETAGEPLWRFPLGEAYDRDIDSPIADMKNIGSAGEAGSITAAQFLQRFIQKGMPWAHLDIAGMAWEFKGKPICPKGAAGFGVYLLERFIAENFEGK